VNYLNPFILLPFLLVSACSPLPEKELDAEQQAAKWLSHKQQVQSISAWQINGRVGIKSEEQNGTASRFWWQQGNKFEMRIIAPLGQGTYILKSTKLGLEMRGPDDLWLTATTPEELMEKGLGWSVDLKGLRYWIRGIPLPDNEHEFSLDGQGRMSTLMQSGFTIDIQRYENIAQYALPKKMKIVGQAMELKLIIKEWQLSSS